jgi:hypothetical protein
VDRVDQGRVELAAGDRLELGGRLAPVERGELDALHPTGPFELGEERQERVAPVELVRAVAHDEEDGAVADVPDEEAEEVASGPVGPVEVLHDEGDRRTLGEAAQHTEDELEQAPLGRADRERCARLDLEGPQVRDEPRQLGSGGADDRVEGLGRRGPDEAAERLDDRGVRNGAFAEVHRSAAEDEPASLADDPADVLDEAGLADAGLAGDEDRLAPALRGTGERHPQTVELGRAADEDGAGDAAGHRRDDRRHRARCPRRNVDNRSGIRSGTWGMARGPSAGGDESPQTEDDGADRGLTPGSRAAAPAGEAGKALLIGLVAELTLTGLDDDGGWLVVEHGVGLPFAIPCAGDLWVCSKAASLGEAGDTSRSLVISAGGRS